MRPCRAPAPGFWPLEDLVQDAPLGPGTPKPVLQCSCSGGCLFTWCASRFGGKGVWEGGWSSLFDSPCSQDSVMGFSRALLFCRMAGSLGNRPFLPPRVAPTVPWPPSFNSCSQRLWAFFYHRVLSEPFIYQAVCFWKEFVGTKVQFSVQISKIRFCLEGVNGVHAEKPIGAV